MESLAAVGTKFVERCAVKTAAVAADDFLATIKRFGFAAAACGVWAGVGRNLRSRFFFVSWPADWLEFYEKNRFSHHDPLLIEARRRISSFWFSEVLPGVKLTAKQEELLAAAATYGYKDVFAVPIHGPGSCLGVVTLAAAERPSLSTVDRAVLEMMSRAVWERCRVSEGFGLSAPERAQLSPREIECIQWAAAGKSDTDIAVLVGIRPSTAHFHIEHAKKRLGVKTRVEAVALRCSKV
jgi:DNA-binding CsgD family transcriptional regulator